MSNVKYLSYEGLEYFWNQKLKPLIEDDEEVIATSLVDLNDRLNTHTHTQYAPTSHTHTKSQITDFPASLKNPYPLIIQGHTYDGTVRKTVSIKELAIANSNTATWYYPTFVTGTSATTENINSGFTVYASNANSSSLGDITLAIGSAASGTVKAQKGFLRIHGEANRTTLRGPKGTANANYSVYLPSEAGTLVVKNDSGIASCDISGSSTNSTNIYINTSTSSSYYPMTFVTTTSAGNTKLYIGGSTGTSSTGAGIRYNPSAKTCYCSGGFYEASDERLKNFGYDIEVDLDKLSKLSKKYFTWKDDESNEQHIGVSAQEVQELYPEIVNVIDDDGHLSVSYDKLSVIALKGIDILNDKVKSLEERLNKLEEKLNIAQ